jgi:hypothetical protein
MKAFLDSIGRGLRHPAGTVVHVGAGTGAVIEDYRSLNPARLLLLEGDPDSAAALREHAAAEPVVEVFGDVVARRDMSLHWYRYTLASMNGPVDRSDLARFYPRLRLLGAQPLKAVAFDRWLAHAVGELDDEHSHVLVMDVPGQEAVLLQALPHALLERFEVVVLKGCAPLVLDGVMPAAFAAARLRERSFEALGDSHDADPLWPVSAWRFDVHGAQVRRLRASVLRLEEEQRQANLALQERDAALSAAREALAAAEKLAEDRAAAIETLQAAQRERDQAMAALVDEQHLQVAQRERERDEAMAALVDEQHLQAAQRERDEAMAPLVDEQHLQTAQRERDEAMAALADEQHLQAALRERDEARTALADSRQRLQVLEDELLSSQRALSAAVRAEALRESDLHELQERHSALTRDQDEARAALADSRQRLHVLEDELLSSQRALSAAVRAEALRESDLHELQERYSALMRDQRGTQELLTKLTDRLIVANRYYEELALAAGQESMPATRSRAQERVPAPVESAR